VRVADRGQRVEQERVALLLGEARDHEQDGGIADAPFAAEGFAGARGFVRADAVVDSCNEGWIDAGCAVAVTDCVRDADQACERGRGVAVFVALRGVGEEIGEVFGADHRDASRVRSADGGVAFPAYAGVDVDDVRRGAVEPAGEVCIVIK